MKTRKMKLVCVTIALSLFVTILAVAEAGDSSAEKRKDIKRLMVLTGAGDIGIQVMNQMVASFKQSLPQVPAAFWDDFKEEINPDALIDLCIPIYDKHLSHGDIREMIRFYQTPAGKRIVKALPLITQESMIVGQMWGQDIARKAVQQPQEKGYK